MTPSRIEQIVEGLDKILSNPALIHYQGENAVLKSYFRSSLLQVAEEAFAEGQESNYQPSETVSLKKIREEAEAKGRNEALNPPVDNLLAR